MLGFFSWFYLSHGPQRAKQSMHAISLGEKYQFQNIRCTLQHRTGLHQHREEMKHHSDIIKNRMSVQNYRKGQGKKISREAAKRATAALKKLQEYLSSTDYSLRVSTSSPLLQRTGYYSMILHAQEKEISRRDSYIIYFY